MIKSGKAENRETAQVLVLFFVIDINSTVSSDIPKSSREESNFTFNFGRTS